MTTLADARFEALRFQGFEGSISDMLYAWLLAGGPGPSPGGYVQNRVFNDANGRLTSTGTLDMGADSDQFILSLWLEAVPILLNDNCVFELTAPGGSKIRLRWTTGAVAVTNLELNIGNVGISDILAGVSTTTFDRTLEHHILIARSGTTLNFYVDGIAVAFNAAPTAATIPFSTVVNGGILSYANSAGAAGYIIGDLYFFAGQYLDMDTPANLARFIDGDGNPVGLGDTGQLPIGSSPQIYLGNPNLAADWSAGTNLGTTGNFALLGGPFIDVIPPLNNVFETTTNPTEQLNARALLAAPIAAGAISTDGLHLRFLWKRFEAAPGNTTGNCILLADPPQPTDGILVQGASAGFQPNSLRFKNSAGSGQGINFNIAPQAGWAYVDLIKTPTQAQMFLNGVNQGTQPLTPDWEYLFEYLFAGEVNAFNSAFRMPYQWAGLQLRSFDGSVNLNFPMREGSGTTFGNDGIGGDATIVNENWVEPADEPPAWEPITTPGVPVALSPVTLGSGPGKTIPDLWHDFLIEFPPGPPPIDVEFWQSANGANFANFASTITLPIANDWRIEFDYLYEPSVTNANAAARPIAQTSNNVRFQFRDPNTSDGDDLRLMASGTDYIVWPLGMQAMQFHQWNHLIFTKIGGVFSYSANGVDQGGSLVQGLGFTVNFPVERIYMGNNQPMGQGAAMVNLEIENITTGDLWEYALDEGSGLISTNANVGTGPNNLTWSEANWETVDEFEARDYHRNDWWYAYLGDQGFTGNMNDRELQFWIDQGPP